MWARISRNALDEIEGWILLIGFGGLWSLIYFFPGQLSTNLCLAACYTTLCISAVVDARIFRLPAGLTALASYFALIFSYFQAVNSYIFYTQLIVALASSLCAWILAVFRFGLGFGDAYLIFALALIIMPGGLTAFGFAALVAAGIVVLGDDQVAAFGPPIVVGTIISFIITVVIS